MILNQPELQFGTESHKLHRREAPDTSIAAAQSVDTTNLEQQVLDVVRRHGIVGCIQDDVIAALPGKAYSSVTARFRALLDRGYVHDTGTRRAGRSGRAQRVLVAKV